MSSKNVSWRPKYFMKSNYVMMSKVYHDVESMQWCQQLCHDAKTSFMTSKLMTLRQKVCHYVKKVHNYIKKCVMCVKVKVCDYVK